MNASLRELDVKASELARHPPAGAVMAAALVRSTSLRRVSNFQIAANAIAQRLPLCTVNATDFDGLDRLDVRLVSPPPRHR